MPLRSAIRSVPTLCKHALAWALVTPAGVALAHSPYLRPNDFTPDRHVRVTVEAAFSEHVFTPDVVMKADSYAVIMPDGASVPLTPIYADSLALLEFPSTAEGTYRITSGERAGRVGKAALIDNEWTFIDPTKPAPPGTKAVDMQSITRADAYIRRGKASAAALAPSGRGIEYQAIDDPTDAHAGKPLRFRLLFDGKPLPNADVEIERGLLGGWENERLPLITSDADGLFTFTPSSAGLYHAMTRYRVGPSGDQPGRSYTYALTLSVNP